MNKKLFYAILDELTEAWYIDTAKLDFECQHMRSGVTRALRYRDVTVEEMRTAITANNDANLTGFPIIERWKHHKVKPEIVRIDKMDK